MLQINEVADQVLLLEHFGLERVVVADVRELVAELVRVENCRRYFVIGALRPLNYIWSDLMSVIRNGLVSGKVAVSSFVSSEVFDRCDLL